ncbi:MAG TPA: hypothetical protein DDY78_22860 [Planctomycetales bacterium]|jgi:hypothetical protein|nr:hypothetical protein [Planctomycetales bacterium]
MIAEMIDVTGLPEQVVADIQKLVATLRKQLPAAKPAASKGELPLWDMKVIGSLSRREIYGDDD